MKKKNIVKISAIVIVLLLVLGVIVYFGMQYKTGADIYNYNYQMSSNERTSDEVLIDWLTNDKDYDVDEFLATYNTEEISIESSEGDHSIPATYIYAPGNTDKTGNTVIMVHGLLGNRISNYPMSEMFLKQGYNVITYDQRSSGGNTAPYTTFGYLESKDLVDYVKYAASYMNEDSLLGVWGQSMGGATVENAMDDASFITNVSYVVLDCPMGNMEDAICMHREFSKLQLSFASMKFKSEIGFSFENQNVCNQIKDTKIPVLFACSKADKEFGVEQVEKLYNAIDGDAKEMFIVDDSDHSNIYFDHQSEYENAIKEFTKK